MSSGDEITAVVAGLVDQVQVEAEGDGWRGETTDEYGDVMFGGFVLGQATHAITRAAPAVARVHSLHSYFLAPVQGGPDVHYEIEVLRDGRRFASRRLEATQQGRPVFTMTASFTADSEGGYEYGRPLDHAIPPPDDLVAEERPSELGPGPWDIRPVGPTEPDRHGVMDSTHRIWMRLARPIDDDPHLHTALVAYMSDITWTGSRPLHLDGDERGIISLDHALWFHRPARADDWRFFDLHSLVNSGGRGLIRGTMHGGDGQLQTSMAQELLLRPYDEVS
ncbi:MAG: thioesterase family protein [Acidimicrobiia bacterium]|nr:thioesterase family protein [Acidimicrobiia bacterium]